MSSVQHDVIVAEDTLGGESEVEVVPHESPGVSKDVPEVRTIRPGCNPRLITVEPLAFIYFFAALASIPLTTQLLYRNVAVHMNVTDVIKQEESTCFANTSDPTYIMQQKVQAVASEWLMYLEVMTRFMNCNVFVLVLSLQTIFWLHGVGLPGGGGVVV